MAEILHEDRQAVDALAAGSLDVAFYRDDIGLRPVLPEAVTDIPVDLGGKVVVLVDDVLFTGRTIQRRPGRAERLRPGAFHPARQGVVDRGYYRDCPSVPTSWRREAHPLA